MKRSLAYSMTSQAYIALIGILLMPVYLHLLGAEVFGLVGLFVAAQAWIQILDMGFTPVLSREFAQVRAGGSSIGATLSRLRTLEWLFFFISLGIVLLIFFMRDVISKHWINSQGLDFVTISQSLVLISVAVVLRWFAALYRGVLVGQERQNRVNMLLMVFATIRFVGVVPLLLILSPSASVFFVFQALVSVFELLASRFVALSGIPNIGIRANLATLKPMFPMVGGVAFLNSVWIFFTQMDKIVLSGFLSLQSYGYFTLAVVASSGILMLIQPLSQVVQPRLNFLSAKGDEDALKELYGLVSQFAVVGFVGLGMGAAFFAEPVLQIWTGSAEVARNSAPVLFWYALGNSAVGVMFAPFMLQFARGDLRLHIYIHAVLVVFLMPLLLFAAHAEGGIGTGKVFFMVNSFFILFWSPVVHHYFLPSLTWRWLFVDTLPIALLVSMVLFFGALFFPSKLTILPSLIWIAVTIFFAMLLGVFFGVHTRKFIVSQLVCFK